MRYKNGAKQKNNMPKIELQNKNLLDIVSPASIFFYFKDASPSKELREIDKKTGGLFFRIMKEESFEGKSGQYFMFHAHAHGFILERIIVVGLGEKKNLTLSEYAKHFGTMLRHLQKKKITKASTYIPAELKQKFSAEIVAKEIAKTAYTSPYDFFNFKSDKDEKVTPFEEIVISEPDKKKNKEIQKGIDEGIVLGRFINMVRDAGNQPSKIATPTYLANLAQDIAKENKAIKVKIFNREDMEKLKMGGLLGVSQGSDEPAKFIVMEYRGKPKSKDIYAFVGKAITFDSGGISLKPSEKMDDMKYDMSGGGAVICAMGAIASLNLPINIVGIVPSCENLPGGRSYKPGDILVAMNGKSMEIANTDAEGRVILADALSYVDATYKPKGIIDLATLTGACVVALGDHVAGLLGNNQKLINDVKRAAEASGDRVWQMPLWKEYFSQIKSDFADMKNVGGRNGGTITAAAFLSNFVGDTPWAHVDIAGTAWHEMEKPHMKRGATGFGLSLLVKLAKDLAKKK